MLYSGIRKEFYIALFVELALFTIGVYLLSKVMVLLFFVVWILTLLMFAGKRVELKPGRIILKWGYLRELKRVITAEDVVDVIVASRARHVVLAKYAPWLLLVPLGMVAVGIWVLLFFPYKFASFGWLLFGVFQLASYVFSNAEKNKALLLVFSITVLSIICAYILGLKVALFSLALIGAVLSGTVWWRESLGAKYLILITKDGNYLLTYSDENDIKSLLVALGGKGGEA